MVSAVVIDRCLYKMMHAGVAGCDMSYHANFCHSVSNCMSVINGDLPKNLTDSDSVRSPRSDSK